MTFHEDLTRTRTVFQEIQKNLEPLRELQKGLEPLRELQKRLAPLREIQETLHSVRMVQTVFKEQASALPALSTGLTALQSLPVARSEPSPVSAPRRPRHPATAGNPEVEASQSAFRARMLERNPDFF